MFSPKSYLQKYGWNEGKGLGKNEDGRASHIRVVKKDDSNGIGANNSNNWLALWDNVYNNAVKNSSSKTTTTTKKKNEKLYDVFVSSNNKTEKKRPVMNNNVYDSVKEHLYHDRSKGKLKRLSEQEQAFEVREATKTKKKKMNDEDMVVVKFHKYCGCGNDFIIINNLDLQYDDDTKSLVTRKLCQRRISVGADGCIFIEPPPPLSSASYTIRYVNADGSEGELCGNGTRCAACYACKWLHNIPLEHCIHTQKAGEIVASVTDSSFNEATIVMPKPSLIVEHRHIMQEFPLIYFVNTGVRHVVCIVDDDKDLNQININALGPFLRYHEVFAPAGANINVIQRRRDDGSGVSVNIRTYERGVECETLACGTGAVAAALLAKVHWYYNADKVYVHALGGVLTITNLSRSNNNDDKRPKLTGAVEMVFKGKIKTKI